MTKEESKKDVQHEKIIILGAGPAGLVAALYAARAELSPYILTGMELGGQVSLTNTIENYPGFPDGIGGTELGELFQHQAERFGARFEFDTATSVDFSQTPFIVNTYSKKFSADALILATGASPVKLNVPGEELLTGRGVSYCGTCDGWFFKNKEIVVIGGGDSALEEGLFLTRFASKVRIIHRRDAFRAGAILQKRLADNEKIEVIFDSVVDRINGDQKVTSIDLRNVKTNKATTLATDGVFVFIGHSPNTSLYKDQLKMDERGFLVIDEKMQTSIPGVFAAGEVGDPIYKQVITSAGLGAAAAIQASKYLETL
ncbi:MAG: thioredoxin-disulfide reductase [Anaerolineaceae bacterium]